MKPDMLQAGNAKKTMIWRVKNMTIDEIIEGLRFTVAMFTFDPMTGETVEIPARKAVKFKAAADLKRMFN